MEGQEVEKRSNQTVVDKKFTHGARACNLPEVCLSLPPNLNGKI